MFVLYLLSSSAYISSFLRPLPFNFLLHLFISSPLFYTYVLSLMLLSCIYYLFLFKHSHRSIFFLTASLFTRVSFPFSTHIFTLSCFPVIHISSLHTHSLLHVLSPCLLCIAHIPASLPMPHSCPPLSPSLFPGRSVRRSLRSSSAASTYITRFLCPPDKIARGATPGECESR